MTDEQISSTMERVAEGIPDATVIEVLSGFSHDRSFEEEPITRAEMVRLAAADVGLGFDDVVRETNFRVNALTTGASNLKNINHVAAVREQDASLSLIGKDGGRRAIEIFIEDSLRSWSVVGNADYTTIQSNKMMAKEDLARAVAVSRHILESETA